MPWVRHPDAGGVKVPAACSHGIGLVFRHFARESLRVAFDTPIRILSSTNTGVSTSGTFSNERWWLTMPLLVFETVQHLLQLGSHSRR